MGRGTVVNAWRALILVGLLLFDPPAHGASLTRQCRRACRDEIAACVASGGERGPCSRQTRRRCQQQGLHYIYQQTCKEKRCEVCMLGQRLL